MGTFAEKINGMVANETSYRELREACRVQLDIEAAFACGKKQTSSQRVAAIKRCLSKDRLFMDGAWDVDGRQYVCNGFCAVELLDRVPGLPEVTQPEKAAPVKKYIDDIEKQVGEISISAEDTEVAVRAALLDKGRDKQTPVRISGTETHVDPVWHHAVVTALGGYAACQLRLSVRPFDGVLVLSSLGRGIIMPVKVKKKEG